MKVIILCGGYGTRLKEETEFRPKPMVFVGGRPLIWHIMKIYESFGFNDFIFALGYKADFIKNFFINQKILTSDFTLNTDSYKTKLYKSNTTPKDKFKITFVDTGLDTLTGERILKCQKYIPQNDKYFMVTYGDAVGDINIKKLFAFHKNKKTLATITGVHPRSRYGLVSETNSLVTRIDEKPILSDWVNGGFMVFNRDALRYFEYGTYEHLALRKLAKERKLAIYKHEGFWFPVDTYKELEDINKIWNKNNIPWKIWD